MHPQPKQESIFRPVYAGWLGLEVYLDAILRATTKKRSSTFLGKKCTPRQNPGYAYGDEMSCYVSLGPVMSKVDDFAAFKKV